MKIYRKYKEIKRIVNLLCRYFEIKPITFFVFYEYANKPYNDNDAIDTLRDTRQADIDIEKRFIRFMYEPHITTIVHEVLHQAEYDLTGYTNEIGWVTVAENINEKKMEMFLKAVENRTRPTRTQTPDWNIFKFEKLIK